MENKKNAQDESALSTSSVHAVDFDSDFKIIRSGARGWKAINRHTGEGASPIYTDPEAAIYYVKRELIQEMEDVVDSILENKR